MINEVTIAAKAAIITTALAFKKPATLLRSIFLIKSINFVFIKFPFMIKLLSDI